METIKYEDFAKIEMKPGIIVEATPHPDADKLVVLRVNMGDDEYRQIVAGIRKHYTCEQLKGLTIIVVTNLEPRTLRGVESHGMLLAATDGAGKLALVSLESCCQASLVGIEHSCEHLISLPAKIG